MVGNERYDVIVLEYYLRAYNNLDVLAGRLRNRFPEATMVFVVTRMPFMFYYKPTHQSLKELLAKEGAKEGWDPHTAVEAVLAGTNQSDWMLTDPPELLAKVKEIADSVKGYVFELRVPEDNFEAIRWYAKMLYLHDQTHYTTYGHQVVYHGVKSVLDLTNANRSDALGAWDYQDNCDLWFQSGQSSLPHHPEMTLRSFSDHRKYALDITSNTTVGWIEISNPAPVNATLYVQYMATNPPAIYPKVKLFMESNDDFVIVDPIVESYRYAVHVTVLVKVSSNVQPGISRVYVEPLEQDKISPFRITGVIVTPAKNVTIAGQ